MANMDLKSNTKVALAFAPVVLTDASTAQVSAVIDTQGFGSLTFAIATGTLTDANATFAVLVEDGDASDLSDNVAVVDDFLVGTEAAAGFTFADDGVVRTIGYVGKKRYVRLTVTPTGNDSGAAPLAAVAILGHPTLAPTVQ